MFNFDLKQTAILGALWGEKTFLFKSVSAFKKTFLYLFIISLVFVVYSFVWGSLYQGLTLGISIIFLAFLAFFWETSLFFDSKIKNPEPKYQLAEASQNPEKYNLAEFLDFEAVKAVWETIKFCRKRKISNISAEALLYFSLIENLETNYIFLRLGFDIVKFRENLKNHLEQLKREEPLEGEFSKEFQEVIETALKTAQQRKRKKIGPREILAGIAKSEFFKEVLIKENLRAEDIENITLWLDFLAKKEEERKKFWEYENLLTYGSMARDWAAGYTITLDQFAVDWREKVKRWLFKAIIGHEKEIEKIQQILTKPETNNVLLVGEEGAGRESIIEAIARRCYLGKSLAELNYNRVVELDVVALLSRITNPEEVEVVLDKIFQEVVYAGNVVLVIREFHNYVALETFKAGAIDISGIIGKYLEYPQFKLIAVTNYAGLHTKIEQNPSLVQQFEKVEISEISEQETLRILANRSLELEIKYKVFVTYPALREIVVLSARYLPNLPFPKKAIDLLEETVVYVANSGKEKIVQPSHAAKIISDKTEIPIGKVEFKEKEILLNLENLIHQRIVNQDEAVQEISSALRRARADVSSKKRPMGVFLFLGPTGVGKTETSKALAEIYFGGEKRMIRLDMSEFQEIKDIQRLIGGPGQEGLLTTPVRESPFSLLLLDEMEKAHPNILNLFLQVFDEGHLTDGQGRKVFFSNTIIVATSNAGANILWEELKSNTQLEKIRIKLLDYFFEKGIFRPEFINRFDGVVIFHPLSKKNLLDISQLILSSLQKNLKEKGIELKISQPLKEKIVELSYNPAFGAREMKRVIQDKVENVLAQALLADKIKRGDKIEITPDFKLKVE